MRLNPHLPLVYHSNYSFSFDPKHRFVMSKFAHLYEQVKGLGIAGNNLVEPILGSPEPLELVHCENYMHFATRPDTQLPQSRADGQGL